MKFENTFEVEAPIDEVYATLLDVERVAPCVPGAEVLEKTGDDAYQVAIKVKVGPISMTYRGTVEIVERDETAHRAVMRAKAREMRGQGTADARVELSLVEEGGRTKGTMVADVQLAGRAAAMGRGIIQDVSAKLVSTFARNLEAMLSGAEPEAAAAPAAAAAPVAAQGTPAGTPAAAQAAGAAQQTGGPIAASAPSTGGPAAAASATASNGQGQQAAAGTPPRPAPAAPAESALPVGQIVGSVLAARLRDPKVLGGLAAAFAAILAGVRRRRKR